MRERMVRTAQSAVPHQHAQNESALNTRPREQESADGGADHAACIGGADVQRHRGAHPLAAHDFADHHAAYRVVGAPAAPVDEAGEREMPDFELSGPGQNREDRRSAAHQQHDDKQGPGAIKAFGKRAQKHPEQPHRKQTEQRHHRDQERRIGALVDDNSDRDGLQPAHGGDDQADIPQTPEVRRTGRDHPPERRVAHAIVSSRGRLAPLRLHYCNPARRNRPFRPNHGG
jgi:hypothetical protein